MPMHAQAVPTPTHAYAGPANRRAALIAPTGTTRSLHVQLSALDSRAHGAASAGTQRMLRVPMARRMSWRVSSAPERTAGMASLPTMSKALMCLAKSAAQGGAGRGSGQGGGGGPAVAASRRYTRFRATIGMAAAAWASCTSASSACCTCSQASCQPEGPSGWGWENCGPMCGVWRKHELAHESEAR